MKKRVLNRESEYLRIGITYYKKLYKPLQHDSKSLHRELKEKIPFFLHYLLELPFTTIYTTKTWFAAEQIMTTALRRVKRYCRNKLEMELEGILLSIQDLSEALTEICLTPTDAQDWSLRRGSSGYELSNIRNVLQYLYAQGRLIFNLSCFTSDVRA
ncbi:MAG: hypothetical protein ACTHK0_18510 [Ginsengibacter sp.]